MRHLENTYLSRTNSSNLRMANKIVFPMASESVFPMASESVFPMACESVFSMASESVFPMASESVFAMASESVFSMASDSVFSMASLMISCCVEMKEQQGILHHHRWNYQLIRTTRNVQLSQKRTTLSSFYLSFQTLTQSYPLLLS